MGAPTVLVIGDCERRAQEHLLVSRVEHELNRNGARVSVVVPTDPAHSVRQLAKVADALVVLTQERHRSFSGPIKIRLDSFEQTTVAGKPFGLVSYGEARPAGTAVDHLRVVIDALRGVVIPSTARTSLAELARYDESTGTCSGRDPITAVVRELLVYARRAAGERELASLAGEGGQRGFAVAQPVDGEISEDIALALAYIKENYSNHGLRLDMVASAVYSSRYHFSRKFRQQTGRRFMDYVAMLRMTEARRLLIQTNLTVTAIAQRVGYGDLANFDRSFKKLFNTRPTEYRMRHADCASGMVARLDRLRGREGLSAEESA